MLGIKSQHPLNGLDVPFFPKGVSLSTCLFFAGMHFRNSFATIYICISGCKDILEIYFYGERNLTMERKWKMSYN